MNKTIHVNFYACLVIFFIMMMFAKAFSQQVKNSGEANTNVELTDAEIRERLKKDGIADSQIEKAMERYKMMHIRIEKTNSIHSKNKNPIAQSYTCVVTPPPPGSCSDLGVESGWGNWMGQFGWATPSNNTSLSYGAPDYIHSCVWNGNDFSTTFMPPPAVATVVPVTGPVTFTGGFTLTSGTGTDPCAPGQTAGNPPLPVVSPLGNTAIMMGARGQAGAGGEKLFYSLTVTPQDTNFVYAYAFVMHDAGGSHGYGDQPFCEFIIRDANGDTIPCSYQRYTGGPTIPGTYLADSMSTTCALSVALGNGSVTSLCYYRPWTLVGVSLAAYVGQTVNIEIRNRDCTMGAHWCWSYWDFNCGVLTPSNVNACSGMANLCGPVNLGGFTYQWYHNTTPYNPSNHWTSIAGATNQCYNTTFAQGDTFMVEVKQPSGCNFRLLFAPSASSNANATITSTNGNCGSLGSASVAMSSGTAPFTYSWSNGQSTQTITGLAAGNYSVSITDAGGCTSTATINITSSSSLTVNTSSTQQLCATPGTASATPAGGNAPYTYVWNNGQSAATATGLAAGNYSVTVTDANGCTGTQTVSVTSTSVFPLSNFSSGPVCLGATTQFTDSSSGSPTSWNWNFGNGNTSTAQNPSQTYTTAGTYSVTLIVSNSSGCSDTITLPVTVDPIPTAIFSPASVCFNNPIPFNNQSTGNPTQWFWNFGDGNTSTQQSPSHTYSAPGTYTASLVVTTASGCKDSTKQIIHINPLPTPNFNAPPVCIGKPTSFSDLSNIATGNITGWSWNFGEPSSSSNISAVQNPSHTYAQAGTYTVVLTVTSDSGCQGTIMIPVQVNLPPVAAFSSPNLCLNNPTLFTDNSTGNPTSWNWSFGDGSPNSIQQNPSHTYLASGTYTVTLIVSSAAGCDDTTTNVVTIYPVPTPLFKADTVCAGNPSSFTDQSFIANGNITSWNWDFGDGGTSMVQNPTHTYAAAGNFSVTLTITSNYGCTSAITVNTAVHGWPTANFCVAPDKAPATDPNFTFCDLWSNDVVQWWWDFGDNSAHDSTNTDPAHSYSAAVTNNDFYNFTITVWVQNQWGCWDTVQKVVEIIPEFTFYIPNCFTPNGDWDNQTFFGKGRGIKEYNIWVFDRWGNMIWDCHREDKNTNWDGPQQEGLPSACKWSGIVQPGGADMSGRSNQLAQEDVYVWKVKLTDIFEGDHTYIGHVSIVR